MISYDAKSGQARQDLTDALKAEPGNKDIRRELTNLKAKEVLSGVACLIMREVYVYGDISHRKTSAAT